MLVSIWFHLTIFVDMVGGNLSGVEVLDKEVPALWRVAWGQLAYRRCTNYCSTPSSIPGQQLQQIRYADTGK